MAEAGLIPGRGQPSLPERGHGVYFAIQTPRGRSSSSAGGRRPRSPIATWPPKTSSGCCPCSCGPPRTHRREAGASPFYSYPIAEGNLPPPPRLPPVNLLRPPQVPSFDCNHKYSAKLPCSGAFSACCHRRQPRSNKTVQFLQAGRVLRWTDLRGAVAAFLMPLMPRRAAQGSCGQRGSGRSRGLQGAPWPPLMRE